MSRMVKAILVDPAARPVVDVLHDASDFRNIYKQIDAACFCLVSLNTAGDTVYLDDNGMYAAKQSLWKLDGYPHPFINKGLVLGTDEEGETDHCTITAAELLPKITWPSIGVMPGTEFHTLDKNLRSIKREVITPAQVVVSDPRDPKDAA